MQGDFRLGDWLVRPMRSCLESQQSSVQIEPKAMDLLVHLANRAGRVVTKQQLIDSVWDGAFVTDEVLTNSIYKLRLALGDDPKNPRFIQTVPKRGYRLIATVEFREAAEEAASDRYRKKERMGPAVSRRWAAWTTLGAILLAAFLFAVPYFSRLYRYEKDAGGATARASIAVLPFDNMSADPDNDYFSDGVTEEIINRLAKLGDLKVISRTSIMQYKETKKSLRQIGAELGVSTILEGSVRRDAERVRITAQLIDTHTDGHLWGDSYDRELADIFSIQSDVSLHIAEALQRQLSPREKKGMGERPTENIAAYDRFLRGRSYRFRSFQDRDFLLAIQMLEKAVKLDSQFALAYAELSEAHSQVYFYFRDRTEQRAAQAKAAADRAVLLQPDLPEAHRALGFYYYWCRLDYDRALKEFHLARAGRPNDSHVLAGMSYIRRRQGRFEEAAATLEQARELDPRSAQVSRELAMTYHLMRDWEKAEEQWDRTISLTPDLVTAHVLKAYLYLNSEGNVGKARRVLKSVGDLGLEETPMFVECAVYTEILGGNYQEALRRLSAPGMEAFEDQFHYTPKELLAAYLYGSWGQPESKLAQLQSARRILEEKLQANPEDSRFHSSLGIVYAGLGRKEDAIREGRLGSELTPISMDAWRGSFRGMDLAQIYVMVGDYDAAIDQLDFLLSIPGWVTVSFLQLDHSVWAPLHHEPKYERLVARHRR